MCTALLRTCLLAGFWATISLAGENGSADAAGTWSSKSAASYLDSRMTWWEAWPTAARDHETFCVSCHTALPYALSRPALRAALQEQSVSPVERKLLDNVIKRVRMWDQVEPFYPDSLRGVPKTVESRGTESILNAVILSRYDAASGELSGDARLALDHMWKEQLTSGEAKGAWNWLQFHNAPWEGDSQYFGATLGAIAAGMAPDGYASTPEVQGKIELLRNYLKDHMAAQMPIDRVMLLWASTKIPVLLDAGGRASIVAETLSKQQADGGFTLSSFVGDWKRKDNTPLDARSDGYATGLVTMALLEARVPRDDIRIRRALDWLAHHQENPEGRWISYSLNKQRDLSSDVGHFMSDAATSYAVLALTHTD